MLAPVVVAVKTIELLGASEMLAAVVVLICRLDPESKMLPDSNKFAPDTLPVADTMPVFTLPLVTLAATLAAAKLPTLLSSITVTPLIFIAIFVLLFYELGLIQSFLELCHFSAQLFY